MPTGENSIIEARRDRVCGSDMSPKLLDRGNKISFVPPQFFVVKNNVIVQISWLHHYWKRFPSIKPGNK